MWAGMVNVLPWRRPARRKQPVFAKKKPQRARIFREIFAKFSRNFQKFSEVFGSVWKFFEVFGRIRMRLDAFERFLAEETAEKTKQTF